MILRLVSEDAEGGRKEPSEQNSLLMAYDSLAIELPEAAMPFKQSLRHAASFVGGWSRGGRRNIKSVS